MQDERPQQWAWGRPAPAMAPGCHALLQEARAYQQQRGLRQWTEDYPALEDVEQDIEAQGAYVLTSGDDLCGYVFLGFQGEPAYESAPDLWRTQAPYGVMHRLAVGSGWHGRGVGPELLRRTEATFKDRGFLSARVDTHEDNAAMRRLLEGAGYEPCGVVWYGPEKRLAYEKPL